MHEQQTTETYTLHGAIEKHKNTQIEMLRDLRTNAVLIN